MPNTVEFYRSFSNVNDIPFENRAQIAFAGRSNVGKSSLLNRLAGQKKLAKTSKTPGRTRLINFFLVDNRFYFVDLPGYGYAKASKKDKAVWSALVESYFQKRENLKGLILLLDCRHEPTGDDQLMIDWLEANGVHYIIAMTKADKLSRGKLLSRQKQFEKRFETEVIPFSANSGIGKKELWGWIEKAVEGPSN